jgi:hypothetical protein
VAHDNALNSGLRILASSVLGALGMAGILALAVYLSGSWPVNDREAAAHDPSFFFFLYGGSLALIILAGLGAGWRAHCFERDRPR